MFRPGFVHYPERTCISDGQARGEMLDCVHKTRRSSHMAHLVGRLPNSNDMTLMLAANRTTTLWYSKYTSLQITTMEFHNECRCLQVSV